MPAPSDPLLEMVDADVAAFRNPRAVVLEHVDWRVIPGEFWVVTGLHLSGKTDLLAAASGIVPPRRGICRLFGHDTRQRDERSLASIRLRLGMVFDGGRLLQNLTLMENVMLPLRYHRNLAPAEARELVEPLLELTGLVQWADASPEVVGRNWQQRAGLARALVLEPEFLLLDNPLSGLDPEDRAWWVELLRALAGGHPVLGGKPITLVVTGDSLDPWRGRPHRFAALRNRRLHVLEPQPAGNVPSSSPSSPAVEPTAAGLGPTSE